jgi:molybdopterin converting factor small subunit
MTSNSNRVRVRLGTGLIEHAGRAIYPLDLAFGTTADGLRAVLAGELPALAGLLPGALVAADGWILAPDDVVPIGVEVALLLPIAGG